MTLAIAIFSLVCYWLIFQKAGEAGWKAIIPYYNKYIEFKIAGKKKLFIPYLIFSILPLIATVLAIYFIIVFFASAFTLAGSVREVTTEYFAMFIVWWLVMIISTIPKLVLEILLTVFLGRSFGRSGGFIVGMVFLSPIFYGILALDSQVVYQGNDIDTVVNSQF